VVCFQRNIGSGFSLARADPDGIGVISLVGQQDASFAEFVCQRIGLHAVGDLPAG